MSRRIKKPPVKPEKRLEWLHRVEREGETLSHISESDGFDIRTVRKHVELARLDRDVQQARSEVLRHALEDHYRDLLDTVRDIERQVSSVSTVSMEKELPLMLGLRQHMPRSPLWENLRKWNRTLTELAELEDVTRSKIQQEIEADGRLNGIISQGANGVIPAAVDVLVHQVKKWAKGLEGFKLNVDFHTEEAQSGKIIPRYGFSHFGEVEKGQGETIRTVLFDFEGIIKQWEEYFEMERLNSRLVRLQKSIGDVLTVVLLRRIVPGKCKFCPL